MALSTLATVGSGLAHIFDTTAGVSPWWLIVGSAIAIGLVVEHNVVAGANLRQTVHRAIGVTVVAAMCVAVAPSVGAQSAGALLPDLISDPPNPSFFNELNTADGKTRLVVTFDGYVHNIGEGPLDVVGNPQEPNGMQQRVRNGDQWENVGTPTVRFETDDGHNHFHLIEVIEYVLWNELQGSQSALGSKIGFCLVDSEVMEPGFDQAYSEELDNFCQENNPGATSLRMGITPGWRDIYDATTTLQWVDVSNVAPGRYWIGALTDPRQEILESNEENNGLVFAEQTISVPGFSPRGPSTVDVEGTPHEITLLANTHGTVGQPVFVIEQGPAHGSLSVPVGASLDQPTLTYTPEPGYSGDDQLVFSVHDAASPYPLDRPMKTIDVRVGAATDEPDAPRDGIAPPLVTAPSTFFESTIGERFEVAVDVVAGDGGAAALHATGLPAGLIVDSATGVISGVPIEEGIFEVELTATQAGLSTPLLLSWIVNPADSTGGLRDVADRSSARGELTRIRVGAGSLGSTFEASGLPPGLAADPTSPLIGGVATEAGTFDVQVRQLNGDEVVAETAFTWTIRPTIAVEFPL